MDYSLENLLKTTIKNGWLKLIDKESNQEYFHKILTKINKKFE